MTGEREFIDYLNDILDSIEKVAHFISGIDYQGFVMDEKTIFAVIRALEIVGEATKKVPNDFKESHPEIPWREMAGLRDKLIHDYVSVNLEIVWKTATIELPELKNSIASLLNDEK